MYEDLSTLTFCYILKLVGLYKTSCLVHSLSARSIRVTFIISSSKCYPYRSIYFGFFDLVHPSLSLRV